MASLVGAADAAYQRGGLLDQPAGSNPAADRRLDLLLDRVGLMFHNSWMAETEWQLKATTNFFGKALEIAESSLRDVPTEYDGKSGPHAYVAVVFASIAVEGFLNTLGALQVADWGKIEKKLDVRQKADKIAQGLGFTIDWGRRPAQRVAQAIRVRNRLVHPKSEERTETVATENDEPPARLLRGTGEEQSTHGFARLLVEATREFLEMFYSQCDALVASRVRGSQMGMTTGSYLP